MIFAGACFWQSVQANVPAEPSEPTLPPRHIVVPAGARKAIFAGGCFWGVQEDFRTIPGVVDTRAGYTGGYTKSPTYESLHSSTTRHVEAVEVTYDPSVVGFEKLVNVFFAKHDPTLPSAKGQGIGKQYHSFIFFHEASQEVIALKVVRQLTYTHQYPGAPSPIVTQIQPAQTFWPAEEHHQFYYEKRGMRSCRL